MIKQVTAVRTALLRCLELIRNAKNLSAGLGNYERCAGLRKLEKELLAVEAQLRLASDFKPDKGLTPEGKLYYREVFRYAFQRDWQNLGELVEGILKNRKERLDEGFTMTNAKEQQLAALSSRFADAYSGLEELWNFLTFTHRTMARAELEAQGIHASLIIRCKDVPDGLAYYQIRISLGDCLAWDHRQLRYSPPMAALQKYGLLAKEDMLRITDVKLILDLQYTFKAYV